MQRKHGASSFWVYRYVNELGRGPPKDQDWRSPERAKANRETTMRFLAILWIVIAVGWPPDGARAQPISSVHSDLAFHFVCKQAIPADLDDEIEGFLKREGFKVLNQARVMRSQGISPFDILIFGLDDKHRIFKFTGFPRTKDKYSVSLITPPPTQRSSDLEDGVLKLVSEQLGCEARQVTQHDNQADAKVAFDRHYKQMEDLFQQAERLKEQQK
jgi:hypothetical protein